CLGAPSACSGRQRWEDTPPSVADALRQLAAAHAQQAPTFRTSLASTRLPVQAALAALRVPGYRADQWPAPSTRGEGLNRLGLRWRNVGKAKPHKKIKEPDAICDHMEKKTRKRRHQPPSNA